MPGRNPIADGYIEVKDRIEKFYEKYPEGTIQSELINYTPQNSEHKGYVIFKAKAYRTPVDTLPGIGHSMLEIPGKTPFTQGSEMENAETSAWGRALAAMGFEVKKSIASADEVSMKQGGAESVGVQAQDDSPGSGVPPPPSGRIATSGMHRKIHAQAKTIGVSVEELSLLRVALTDKSSASEFTYDDVDKILAAIQSRETFEAALPKIEEQIEDAVRESQMGADL